jgi:hypothetical protein
MTQRLKECPTCGASVAVLIVNLANGQSFCHKCSGLACPTFMAHYLLTREDVAWLRACGIDPEVPSIEDCIKQRTRTSRTGTPTMTADQGSGRESACRGSMTGHVRYCAVVQIG